VNIKRDKHQSYLGSYTDVPNWFPWKSARRICHWSCYTTFTHKDGLLFL